MTTPSTKRRQLTQALVKHALNANVCYAEAYQSRLRRVALNVFRAVPEVLEDSLLALLFVYDMDQQPHDTILGQCDGDCLVGWKQHRRYCAIGISKQALDYSDDYAAFVLLHELTHMLMMKNYRQSGIDGHGGDFHPTLDRLIERYNHFHGAHLENDCV